MPEWLQIVAAVLALAMQSGIVGLLLKNGTKTASLAERLLDIRTSIGEPKSAIGGRVDGAVCVERHRALAGTLDSVDRRISRLERSVFHGHAADESQDRRLPRLPGGGT